MNKRYSLAALLLLSGAGLTTQAQHAARGPQQAPGADHSPALITFRADQKPYGLPEAQAALREQLQLTPADRLERLRTEQDQLGFTHEKYAQYFKGVRVEHGSYSVHAKDGVIRSVSGNFERIRDLDVTPALTAAQALQHALEAVGAKRYLWQDAAAEADLKRQEQNPAATYRPTGELVIVTDHLSQDPARAGQPVLAWKFDVYAQQPLSRDYVYIDARSGAVVLRDAIIKHAVAPGSVATAYSGTQPSNTDSYNGSFRLRDYSRGQGVETFNLQRGTDYAAATDFVDNDNNWTAAEFGNANQDNVALDAHWGAQSTYDYWLNVHGRNSYNNAGAPIRSYVHYASSYENAFWDGARMTYGDGAARFRPLTALDVCGHEIGHAVCSSTANLTYSGESGALNEALSDIWGACIEQYTCANAGLTKQTWLVGEDIDKQQTALRSMSDPRSLGQPAYYRGVNWYSGSGDNGGVHTNSGVINHWFYILTQGKSGVNEGNNSYCVTGIGINDAARIVYRAESVYLTAASDYNAARTYTMQAANDLFGPKSTQAIAVANAWFAVGIGSVASAAITGPVTLCNTGLYDLGTPATWSVAPAGLVTTGLNAGGSQLWVYPVAGAAGLLTITASYQDACGQHDVTQKVTIGAPRPTVTSQQSSGTGEPTTYLFKATEFPGATYTWYVNGTVIPDESSSLMDYYFPCRVTKTITCTVNNACGTSPLSNSVARTGGCTRTGTALKTSYELWPNPAATELAVEAYFGPAATSPETLAAQQQARATPFEARLYTIYGELVRTGQSNQGKLKLSTADLPNGLYTLKVGNGDNQTVKHVQIAH